MTLIGSIDYWHTWMLVSERVCVRDLYILDSCSWTHMNKLRNVGEREREKERERESVRERERERICHVGIEISNSNL